MTATCAPICSTTDTVWQSAHSHQLTNQLTDWHCATGLHFTYPKDKQRAQEVKEKLIAAHDLEVQGGDLEQHQVKLQAVLLFAHALAALSCSNPHS